MKIVSSTEAKAQLNALLAEVERTGSPVTITTHGRPVAVLTPVQPRTRTFGQLPGLVIGADFDDPLPEADIVEWEGKTDAARPEA
jgi:prevent-host-death family protein